MLYCDFKKRILRSIPTSPVAALTEFLYSDAETNEDHGTLVQVLSLSISLSLYIYIYIHFVIFIWVLDIFLESKFNTSSFWGKMDKFLLADRSRG